ncbi:MAG: hypothetical protein MPJ24_11730 [Pirellulaceae bacterium]|nr:hypothetical protein [Pirellulaceae bacterium]
MEKKFKESGILGFNHTGNKRLNYGEKSWEGLKKRGYSTVGWVSYLGGYSVAEHISIPKKFKGTSREESYPLKPLADEDGQVDCQPGNRTILDFSNHTYGTLKGESEKYKEKTVRLPIIFDNDDYIRRLKKDSYDFYGSFCRGKIQYE